MSGIRSAAPRPGSLPCLAAACFVSGCAALEAGIAACGLALHAAIAVSGLTALASELIWTRLLALQFGGTVCTFALILAGFLAGLGLGNLAGAAVAAGSWPPRVAFGWCQMLLVAAMAWAAHQIAGSLPHWPIDPALARSPAVVFQLDLVRCLWVVLPAAILWGASFPLAVAAVAGPDLDATRIVGGIAGANTIGGIAGALGAGVILVAWLGSQAAQQAMMALAAGAGVLLVAPAARRPVAAAALAVAVAARPPPLPQRRQGPGFE